MRLISILVCAVLLSGAMLAAIKLSPLFLNSRIERIGERHLPQILIQRGNLVYCRMKADDFSFPLPSGSRAKNPILTSGGFDTVEGTVEACFESTNHVTAHEYLKSLKLQAGGQVTAGTIPGGLLIRFNYFGDK